VQQRASVWFVFTVVLIDMIGFGLVMPVLPGLIMELGRMSIDRAAIWAGWLAAGYAAMQFVCAPVIGNLSDRFGRRPVLLACLFAYGCDYLLQGFAPSLAWLIVGRIVAGMTGASVSAAYAYIADVTVPRRSGRWAWHSASGSSSGPRWAGSWASSERGCPFSPLRR
jgi:DHA1 family tetracycline resistance protein-like MFS transporter